MATKNDVECSNDALLYLGPDGRSRLGMRIAHAFYVPTSRAPKKSSVIDMEKLDFRLTHFSGEDAEYRAVELNKHTPSTKGWQTARFCEYPQEIGLELLVAIDDLGLLLVL